MQGFEGRAGYDGEPGIQGDNGLPVCISCICLVLNCMWKSILYSRSFYQLFYKCISTNH